jgi:hypothetical protein
MMSLRGMCWHVLLNTYPSPGYYRDGEVAGSRGFGAHREEGEVRMAPKMGIRKAQGQRRKVQRQYVVVGGTRRRGPTVGDPITL